MLIRSHSVQRIAGSMAVCSEQQQHVCCDENRMLTEWSTSSFDPSLLDISTLVVTRTSWSQCPDYRPPWSKCATDYSLALRYKEQQAFVDHTLH